MSSLATLPPPASIADRHGTCNRSDIAGKVSRLAGALVGRGAEPGDVIAWQLPNRLGADLLYRASWRIGAVAAPIHHRAGRREVDELVRRLEPRVLVGEPAVAVIEHPTAVLVADLVGAVTAPVDRPVAIDPDEVAVLLSTAGSTGSPKLVAHNHRLLRHKAEQMVSVHGLDDRDCVLMPAPLAHVSGLLNGILLPSAAGMRVVLMDRWSPADALDLIEARQVTFMVGPPTFFVGLLEDPAFSPTRVASLRLVSTGGAGVTDGFASMAADRFDCVVKRTYGSTEAPTIATTPAPLHQDPHAHTTDGLVLPPAELRTVTPGTDDDLPAGAVGEILIGGAAVCAGYFEGAGTPIRPVGDWLRTGDLGSVDADGWLTITGRLKDVIIRGGENIAAAEVEAALVEHPLVSAACVVGVPDDRLGERVAAFVVTDGVAEASGAEGSFDLDTCRAWFVERGMARYKTPEVLHLVTELPLLSSGKIDRERLRLAAVTADAGS